MEDNTIENESWPASHEQTEALVGDVLTLANGVWNDAMSEAVELTLAKYTPQQRGDMRLKAQLVLSEARQCEHLELSDLLNVAMAQAVLAKSTQQERIQAEVQAHVLSEKQKRAQSRQKGIWAWLKRKS